MASKTPPEIDAINPLLLKCHDTVDALAGYIASLDDSLRRCDYFLHKLQPPHKGRVRIKLVLRKGTYVPSPIEYFYVKAIGEWTYKQLPNTHLPKRAKRTKAFYDTAKQVVEVLCVAQELLAKRSEAVRRLNAFRLSGVNSLQAQKFRVDELLAVLDGWSTGPM